MLDREVIIGTNSTQDLLDDVLGVLDAVWVEVILGVKIKVNSVVSECLHIGPTAGLLTALRVRGTHVGRVLSNYVGNSALVLHHLLLSHVRSDVG